MTNEEYYNVYESFGFGLLCKLVKQLPTFEYHLPCVFFHFHVDVVCMSYENKRHTFNLSVKNTVMFTNGCLQKTCHTNLKLIKYDVLEGTYNSINFRGNIMLICYRLKLRTLRGYYCPYWMVSH